MLKYITSVVFLFFFLVNVMVGQYAMDLTPRISSDNSISERVAYTKISIDYGSPKVRGRQIWGEMQEYGQIWRAGANMATVISFSEKVKIQGKELPRGSYSFFVIPRENEPWTVIFNKVAQQWGAFGYEESEDALRIEVDPVINNHVEDLTFDIIAKDFDGAYVVLEWASVKISFYVEVEHYIVLEEKLAEKLETLPRNTHWVIYLQAANYLIDEEERLDVAAKWLKASEDLYSEDGEWSGQYYPKAYIKGDLLWANAKLSALNGDFSSALNYAEKMKAIPGDYVFYDRENEVEQIDQRIEEWGRK
ncbi:DUF2911 domain-containing protein [Portibacter lacus]|uniref:DUF2911 domain-containing protein n=1 Tax=Portibacter lacus TaxID=1099794 RepID=A0AA37SL68_9BACT|nr:DUF2911 domain-containing protein [Portibacter lacus]GLR15649.1 hypothetical protein GCM10007940_02640 [Portibacter lacus]